MLNFKTMKSNAFKCVALLLLLLTVAMVGLVGCGEDVPTVSDVVVSTQPTKVQYEVGEKFDYTGAKLKVTYDDGTTADVDVTSSMIDLFTIDFSTTGSKNITVTYTDGNGNTKNTVITVTVVDTLGGKKAEQIKAINDYTALTDSAIVALKASYINAVNAADDESKLAAIFNEYKAAVDAYTTASTALKNAVADAKNTINGLDTDVKKLPVSAQNVINDYKQLTLSALELAGNTTEVTAIVDGYKALVKKMADTNLDYSDAVDEEAIELYTQVCLAFHELELSQSKYYSPDAWAEVIAIVEETKATILRADDKFVDTNGDGTPDIIDTFIDEVLAVNTLLDDIYDLIIAFDDKAMTVVNDRYPFIMYKEADYADELAAIKTAIDALPAELQPGLSTYVIKGTSTAFPLDENYAARQLRYDVLAQALVAAANVDAAIVAVPEIALYLDLVANGTVADPADYVTIATDLTAVVATLDAWLDQYDMIWSIGTDGELAEIPAFVLGCVVDPNVNDMIENLDLLVAALEKFALLEDSIADLTAIGIQAKLDAILSADCWYTDCTDCACDDPNCTDCDCAACLAGNHSRYFVHITEKAAMDEIQAAIDAWCAKYDIPESRITGYAADASAYVAYKVQKTHLNNMLAAEAEYNAEGGIKDMIQAITSKDIVLTEEVYEEIYDLVMEMVAWLYTYGVDECNGMYIMRDDFAAIQEAAARYDELVEAYEDSDAVRAAIKALVDQVAADGGVKLDHATQIDAVTDAIEAWATLYDVDDANVEIILNYADAVNPANLYSNTTTAVDSYKDILAAFAALKDEWQAKADAVNEKIDAIGTVTKDSAGAIEDAREALEDFLDEISAITNLTDDTIIDTFGIKEDDLIAAEAALVALYIADLGTPSTDIISDVVEALEVYFAWTGVEQYDEGGNTVIIADVIEAANNLVANETNTAYADVVRFPVYARVFAYLANSGINHTAIADFDKLDTIVGELEQICDAFSELKDSIDALPAPDALAYPADELAVATAKRDFNAFKANNSAAQDPLAPILADDYAKLNACIDKMEQLKFAALIEQCKGEIAREADAALQAIVNGAWDGSTWYRSIEVTRDNAYAALDELVYNQSYNNANGAPVTAAVKADEITDVAIALIRDLLSNYYTARPTTPVVPGP